MVDPTTSLLLEQDGEESATFELIPSPEELEEEVERLRGMVIDQEERLHAIQEIGRAMGSTGSIDDVLSLIMERITELMNAERSTLFLVDDEKGELWSKLTQGPRVSEIRIRIGEGIAGWVARTGKSLNIKDAYLDERFDHSVDRKTGFQTRSCLCQPIRNHNRRIIGVVQVLNKRKGYFTVEDENLLSSIASQAAVSLENSKLFLSVVAKNIELEEYKDRLEQKMYEIDLLYEVEREAVQAPDLDTLLTSVGQKCIEALDSQVAAITLRRENDFAIHCILRDKRTGTFDVEITPLLQSESVGMEVIRRGRAFFCNDACTPSVNPETLARLGIETQSVMAVPLSADDRVIGALEVINKSGYSEEAKPRHFDNSDLKILTLVGAHISAAVATQINREKQEKAQRLSSIGQMVSSVLHDLKTPISIISGYVQLMVNQDSNAVRDQYASSILKQFDTLNSMTKELLAFARGDSTILIRKVYMTKFMDEAKQLLQNELIGRSIELAVEAKYRGIARFDEVKLKRVFANLARNAAEAMNHGGRLTVTAERRGEDRLVFVFMDTGSGIPREIHGRLYESFVTAGKQNGTGLGLAIVKKIVDDHEGRISFVTEPDRGTTFTVELPLKR